VERQPRHLWVIWKYGDPFQKLLHQDSTPSGAPDGSDVEVGKNLGRPRQWPWCRAR
jgi:hypothetical protein